MSESEYTVATSVVDLGLYAQARADLTEAKRAPARVVSIRSRQNEVELENLILRQRNGMLESLLAVALRNAARVSDELKRPQPDVSWCLNVLDGDINQPLRRW